MTTPRDSTITYRAPRADQRAALEALVRSRGLETFAFFDTVGEGRFFPNGIEEVSGRVLGSDGRAFYFWTDWDAVRGEPTFRFWQPLDDLSPWAGDRAYRRAREKLGLTR
jgi:hypothetical protein